MRAGKGKYFDFENNEKDKEFKRLKEYYQGAGMQLYQYGAYVRDPSRTAQTNGSFEAISDSVRMGPEREAGIAGPRMTDKQVNLYKKNLKQRAKQGGWSKRLFGRYK